MPSIRMCDVPARLSSRVNIAQVRPLRARAACVPFASQQKFSRAASSGLVHSNTSAGDAPLRARFQLGRRGRSCSGLTIRCDAVGKKAVAITGGTGLIGSRVASKLAAQGWAVRILTRNPGSAKFKLTFPGLEFYGPSQWASAIQGADAVVNLAGEPIGTRWTPQIKQEILRSRLDVTKTVVAAISSAPADKRPSVLVSASAVGFYGASPVATFNEDSPSGSDYLANVCRQWEAAAQALPAGVRVAILRIGIVLAPDGGVLSRMKPVFEIFAGGPLGSGKQWVSWVHREDLVNMVVEAVNNPQYSGVYNATAPRPVRMSELCSGLGTLLGRPSWLPVPDFAIQTLLGEGASVVLEGQRVLPAKAQAQGFQFQYNEVLDALRAVYK